MITLSIILTVVITVSFFIIRNLILRNEKLEDISSIIDIYLHDIEKEIMFFQKFCDKFNIKLHLILQPCLYVTKKKININFKILKQFVINQTNIIFL